MSLPDPIPSEPRPVLEYASPGVDAKSRRPMSGVLRFAGLYAGVVVPVACFVLSASGFTFGPRHQSGTGADYARLLLWPSVAWPFFPLLAYSITGMALVCASPLRFAPYFAVRLAIDTGVLLAAQFAVIVFLTFTLEDANSGLIAAAVWFVGTLISAGLLRLADFLFRRFGVARVWAVAACIASVPLFVGLVIEPNSVASVALGGPLVLSALLGTPWAVAVYAIMAARVRQLANAAEAPGGRVALALPGWVAAYVGAWALAVHQAIRAYQALPKTSSGCYVASAAAGGHPRFVRSRPVGGVPVNDQLRRLKCAEIALATLAPVLHQSLRRLYDRVGPVLARGLRWSPWLADVAYVSLKPAEWGSTLILRRTVADFDHLSQRLYSANARTASLPTARWARSASDDPEILRGTAGADAGPNRD